MKLKIIWGIAIIAILAGLIVLLGGGERVDETSNNQRGESQNEVVFTEALDFGCPACSQYQPLIEEYYQEFGDRVIFEARHFPIRSLHPNALAGHRAAEAAARQDKFWEMHDLLFEERDLWIASTTDNPVPQLEVFATELGLDIDQFRLDFASAELNSVINNDIKLMKEKGVSSTPTFFLNGQEISGQVVATADEFRQLLEEAIGDQDASQPEETPQAEAGDHSHEPGTEEHEH